MSDPRHQRQDLLRSVGLRATGPRLAVLDVLEERAHLTVEDILVEVRGRRTGDKSVSVQTVYDVVHALTDRGLLRRIEPAGSATRYERRVGDNHHHVVCRTCGAVADIPCVRGQAPCLDPSDTYGFRIEEAEVTFWGTCESCRHPDVEHGVADVEHGVA